MVIIRNALTWSRWASKPKRWRLLSDRRGQPWRTGCRRDGDGVGGGGPGAATLERPGTMGASDIPELRIFPLLPGLINPFSPPQRFLSLSSSLPSAHPLCTQIRPRSSLVSPHPHLSSCHLYVPAPPRTTLQAGDAKAFSCSCYKPRHVVVVAAERAC